MATTIEVNKQSVKQLLESGKERSFVIPEYQRPYAWQQEQAQTLFDDLWEFTANGTGGPDSKNTYFLGSIVAYENEEGEQEIIDGQQRITSLFLLLRAIYTMLTNSDTKTKEASNFIKQIEPAIWRTDKLTGEVDYSNILITSKVLNNDGNQILRDILKTGIADKKATDNYSKNYLKFQELFENVSKNNPLIIYNFIYVILHQAILLPITADTQDTALTIFSTLNNRGLPLSDADIFKAKIYNHLDKLEKNKFIDDWKELEENASIMDETIQQLFYYYMFYLRALEKDNKTTTPGIRKYYAPDKSDKLYRPGLMEDLMLILNVWKVVKKHEEIENESWSRNIKIKQTLDTLNSYPNEFWKYPVVIYYLCHRKNPDFERNFEIFLNKLLSELLTKYLMTPTINAVKSDILKLNVEIINSSLPKFDFKEIDMLLIKNEIKKPHRNAVRMLLKILAYNNQDTLLPEKWEIEHIFPQKWQTNYFINISDDIIKEKIEHIGNKLPFEKRLNIIAGNGYFQKKKKEYALSKIAITHSMSESKTLEWSLDSISERDIRVSDTIVDILENWNSNYYKASNPTAVNSPSQEEITLIQEFKQKGWI